MIFIEIKMMDGFFLHISNHEQLACFQHDLWEGKGKMRDCYQSGNGKARHKYLEEGNGSVQHFQGHSFIQLKRQYKHYYKNTFSKLMHSALHKPTHSYRTLPCHLVSFIQHFCTAGNIETHKRFVFLNASSHIISVFNFLVT